MSLKQKHINRCDRAKVCLFVCLFGVILFLNKKIVRLKASWFIYKITCIAGDETLRHQTKPLRMCSHCHRVFCLCAKTSKSIASIEMPKSARGCEQTRFAERDLCGASIRDLASIKFCAIYVHDLALALSIQFIYSYKQIN